MLARTGWAIAAFWMARFLLFGLPAMVLEPGQRWQLSTWGFVGMGPNTHPWFGLAMAVLAGLALREKGPLLWMAAGMALCERLGGPRGFHPDWVHAGAIGIFVAGVHRSRMGMGPLIGGVLAPLGVLPMVLYRFRPGWQQPALLCLAAAIVIALVTWRRPRWELALWRPWPGFAASALLLGASAGGSEWLRAREAAARQAAMAALPKLDLTAPYRLDFFQRGVSFTAEGVPYDAPQARAMLANLPGYGVDAIALVPYGFSPRGEQRRIRIPGRTESWENEDGMELLTAEAHRLGLRVMLKPHVWRLQGRAPIAEAEAKEWLAEYKPYIEHYAEFAARTRADVLCIGTELKGLTPHEGAWREIIAAVRARYPGPLVYAANHGEEFESIRFWDALDYIGIDNYYPLGDGYSAREVVEKIEAVQRRYGKPVLFTEAGFGAHAGSHREPWEDESKKPLDLQEQARSYDALLAAVYRKPWFRGVYWWKVGTNGYGGPENNSMTPWRKPAMEIVKRYYLLPVPQR